MVLFVQILTGSRASLPNFGVEIGISNFCSNAFSVKSDLNLVQKQTTFRLNKNFPFQQTFDVT